MDDADALMHSLKIRYGIPPEDCTTENMAAFLMAYRKASAETGDRKAAWDRITRNISTYFPSAGKFKYGAQDHKDLKAAADNLLQILQNAKK